MDFVQIRERGEHGFIAVPEGLKGEGWRWFAEKLTEAVFMSSAPGMKNRASQRACPHAHVFSGLKGSFGVVLTRSSLSLDAHGCLVAGGMICGVASGEVVQPKLKFPKNDVWFSWGGSTRLNDGSSLMAMQTVLLT